MAAGLPHTLGHNVRRPPIPIQGRAPDQSPGPDSLLREEGNPMTGEDEEITLGQAREKARERLKGICTVNKVCDGGPGRFCQGQKFGAPIGLGGTGKGLSFTVNVQAIDDVKLKTRLIGPHFEPDLSTTLFGSDISMPFLPSSMSGVKAVKSRSACSLCIRNSARWYSWRLSTCSKR